MSVKFVIVFYAQCVCLQFVQSHCTRSPFIVTSPLPASTFSLPGRPEIIAPAIEVTPTTGGALPVTCISAYPEEPLTVESKTAYEGTLSVNGELPFVGTVAVSGELPTAGTGAVNHACGSKVRMSNEFFRPSIGNLVIPANAVATSNNRVGNAAVAPALPIAANLNCNRGFGSRHLGYADTRVAGLGLVNGLGAAVGLGNARYGVANVGKTVFGVADVGNCANAKSSVGFRGASVSNIGYGANGVSSTRYGGVGVTNAVYGGTGEGAVAVIGELPVAGTTVVAGQLPIVGAVCFSGNTPAFGTVTISGSCSCDCGRYLY